MAKSVTGDWSAYTVIDGDDLLERVFQTDEELDGKINVKRYCITVGGDTIDTEGFIEFLKEKFLYLVFPEEEIEERGVLAYNEALQRAGYKDDYVRSGIYGELLLFVFVDAILEMPLICHKIALKQDPSDEQKGSDGVFFGEYNDSECLGIGEAKFYQDRDGAIRSSLESSMGFHGGEGDVERSQEINVATRNLSENLPKDELEALADRLTSPSRDYNLVHPIFIGYEANELHTIQTEAMDSAELEEKIRDFVDSEGEILPYIRDRLKSDYPDLEKHHLVFILLPVEDSDTFKERMRNAIYPHISD